MLKHFRFNQTVSYYSIWSKTSPTIPIVEYLFQRNIYKKETTGFANNGLDSWLFLKSFYWATMAHQVLEEYNSFQKYKPWWSLKKQRSWPASTV